MGKRKKSDKSLGQDPFEDMERMDWEDELPPGSDQTEPPTEEEESESAPGETEAEAEPVEAAADTEVEPAKAEESQAAEPTEEGPVLSTDEGPAPEQAGVQPEAEPEEETSHLLDELVAIIDEEVEEAFGPGAMTDPATAEPTDQGGGEEQYVIFSLAGAEYAVQADNVREIGEPPDVTPVPNVPDWVLGVANLRGDILSLVDLRLFLGMERTDYDEDTRVMVVHTEQDASSVTTGLMVDLVSDIRYLPVDRISAPTASIEDQVAPYLRGVYEHDSRLLVVLDLDQLLLSSEMRQFEPV